MHSDLKNLLQQAEENYLEERQIKQFQIFTVDLAHRLKTYELLRDNEVEIFQPIADELTRAYPQQSSQLIEKALKHWLSIMRYCAMAMLLNNPEYLQRSVLEWLTDMVQAHQMQSVESTIYDLLLSQLQKMLSRQQFASIEPFLEQSKAILGDRVTTTVGEQK